MKKIDYHMHTLCSDGSLTVTQVIDRAIFEKVDAIAITDHDTVSAIAIAKEYSKGKIHYQTGIEITGKEYAFNGMKQLFSLHLLGYGIDETNEEMLAYIEKRKAIEEKIYQELWKELSIYGYVVKREEIALSSGNVLQLCDVIAHVKGMNENVERQILERIDAYALRLTECNTDIKEAIQMIHKAGGIAVWAHPFVVYSFGEKLSQNREDVATMLKILIEMGLDGIEARYLNFTKEQQEYLLLLAKENKLKVTAGSDFHGSCTRNQMGVLREEMGGIQVDEYTDFWN